MRAALLIEIKSPTSLQNNETIVSESPEQVSVPLDLGAKAVFDGD